MKASSNRPADAYRALQQHLDRHPMGFPETSGNAAVKVLKHIFTPAQAELATCLSHHARSVDEIFSRAGTLVSSKTELEQKLDEIVARGGIESGGGPGKKWYRNAPLVVGMYEYQLGRLSPEFVKDFAEYTSAREFGISFLSTQLPQMRTIPIGKSIRVDIPPQPFDTVSDLLKNSRGPFAICECICRKKQGMLGNACKATDRTETCLAVGHLAQTAVTIKMGRAIDRDTAVSILEKNQAQGLVLQPSNTRDIDFICSCCGCCCGMLRMQQKLPKPVDFWASNFQAQIDTAACTGCGICAEKCQVDAVSKQKKKKWYAVNRHQCIGCGLCVAACPAKAVVLEKTSEQTVPPKNRDTLLEIIGSHKKGRMGKLLVTGKLVKDALVTGRTEILKSH